MRSSIRVSTPGKLILMGEHAAVYGVPAVVTAIGLRLVVRLERTNEAGIGLDLPAIGHREHQSQAQIAEYRDQQRQAWETYAANPSPDTFAGLRDGQPARLARLAMGECVEPLGDLDGLRLNVTSDLPLGAGFGSSAAAAVGIVSAAAALSGEVPCWSQVGPLALEVERRQHGLPSGIDAAAVFHGGVLSVTRREEGLGIEPLMARPDLLDQIRVLHTGTSAESTGQVVAAVRELREKQPAAFEERLSVMRDATSTFRDGLTSPDAAALDLIEPMRAYQGCLEQLGVVPNEVGEAVREIERRGGAAKLSGAGALSGPAAGCLLALLPEGVALGSRWEEIAAPLAAEGVRVEMVK